MNEERFELSEYSTVYRYSVIDNLQKGTLKANEIIILLSKQAKKIDEQQATIEQLAKKWRLLSQENMQLKDYIDTIFEDNTHICKYLDVEDMKFYCDKNKDYRSPSCLYEKCFDEENLIKIKDEIRRVLE